MFITLMLLISAAPIATATSEVALTAVASASTDCKVGSGVPGGFYWCYGKNFDNLGSDMGCSWEPPLDTCWSFDYPRDVRRSIGPDSGGYCKFYKGLDCTGSVLGVWIGDKVFDQLECPGSSDMQGLLGKSMKCFGL